MTREMFSDVIGLAALSVTALVVLWLPAILQG